jgi:hemoglobin
MVNASERRHLLGAEITARTGISESMIEALVRAFYAKVRGDALLGPIFAARISDWERHLHRMCTFWSSVALMTGSYHGNPMLMHVPLPIDASHFDRWLALFEETCGELCPPPAALHFIERAQRIAQSLELGIAASRGQVLGQHERLRKFPDTNPKGGARDACSPRAPEICNN